MPAGVNFLRPPRNPFRATVLSRYHCNKSPTYLATPHFSDITDFRAAFRYAC